MLQRWIGRLRQAQGSRQAADLQSWLTSIDLILQTCVSTLRAQGPVPDIGVILDGVDRELMRFRNYADDIRRPLRRHSRVLADRVAQETDRAYHLRNQTCAFLLRWQTAQQTDLSSLHGPTARREMEEVQLQASRTARQLTSDLETLAPELRALIAEWAAARGHTGR